MTNMDKEFYAPSLVLDFWFSEINRAKWFVKDDDFDQAIQGRFTDLYLLALQNQLDDWKVSSAGCLALVISLDQFPRNMFRGSKDSFASDHLALATTKYAIEHGLDTELSNEQKAFLYMPLMHSENLDDQNLSVELFSVLHEDNFYALRHREIIERFGRFPHRNEMLGREATAEEIVFLNEPHSSF